MAVNYAFNYAQIDPNTGMCTAVKTTTIDCSDDPTQVEIPVYDPEYICKYYINGSWWVDAAGTIPWQSALLPE